MGTLADSKISNRYGSIQPGDLIALTFDHGKLDHPVYGSASRLTAQIPLLLRQGEFILPTIINEPHRLEKFAKEKKCDYVELWENDLDEEIEAKLKDCALASTFMYPQEDFDGPKMQVIIMFAIMSLAADDVFDQMEDLDGIGISYKDRKAIDMIFDIINDSSPNPEHRMMRIPQCVPLVRFLSKFNEICQSVYPDHKEKSEKVLKEGRNIFLSLALIRENNRAPLEDQFSEEMLQDFDAHLSGFLPALEVKAIEQNLEIPNDVRLDMLMGMFRTKLSCVCTIMNDIFGFRRDVELDQVHDSSILRQVVYKGVSLQQAFDNAVTKLIRILNDIRIAAKKLRERYADMPSVLAYIKAGELFSDGQFYTYLHARRYGKVNMQIEKFNVDLNNQK